MRRRSYAFVAAVSLTAFLTPQAARGEVYVELDALGHFVSTHIVPAMSGRTAKIWEPVGAAASSALVLNPNGDFLKDGPPDIAVNPLTNSPRAVWASRRAKSYDIYSSVFKGTAWTVPDRVSTDTYLSDDFDPKIVFTGDGLGIVTWWEKGSLPVVRMAVYSPKRDGWTQIGVVSKTGEKAKQPAIRQEGGLTIIAYRTPEGIKINTFLILAPLFADGPTPFPRDQPPPGLPPQ